MRIPASMTCGPIPSPGTNAMFLNLDMARVDYGRGSNTSSVRSAYIGGVQAGS
jgi:hypothetical protein